MDLTGLLAAVRGRLGTLTSDAFQTDAVLTEFINTALHDFESDRDWWWYQTADTITTTTGDNAYAVEDEWRRTESVSLPDWQELVYLPHQMWLSIYNSSQVTGRPCHWSWWERNILLGPTPDGVYVLTHNWYQVETDLASPSDEPVMPFRYHRAVADLAAVYALGRDREGATGQMLEVRVSQARAQMLREQNVRKGPTPVRLRNAGWY